ncbi:MAG: hypothetical protein ACRDG9_04125, partial [Actinomycetota bacterium]
MLQQPSGFLACSNRQDRPQLAALDVALALLTMAPGYVYVHPTPSEGTPQQWLDHPHRLHTPLGDCLRVRRE